MGQGWQQGSLSIADEHRVSAVAVRLVGRLGPYFVRRGRQHGTVVVGAAPGDPHSLPVSLLGDLVRAQGYRVVDLGGNVPVASFVSAVAGADRVVAAGVSVSDVDLLEMAGAVVAAVQELGVPVLVGGPATDEATAATLGADGWAPDGAAAADLIATLSAGPT